MLKITIEPHSADKTERLCEFKAVFDEPDGFESGVAFMCNLTKEERAFLLRFSEYYLSSAILELIYHSRRSRMTHGSIRAKLKAALTKRFKILR